MNFDEIKRVALKKIEAFVLSFSVPQNFAAAMMSSAPKALGQVAEAVRIPEAGHLRCRFFLFIPFSNTNLEDSHLKN
jgi:hypothetical protein